MSQSEGARAPADTPDASPVDRRFFGHPIGLMTLFGTELWERFSYYGMRAILLYYLTDTVADGGLGLDSDTGLAVTSIYGASVYLLSVVGGWLADRVIGSRRATLYGGMVIAAGHVLLAVPGGAGVSFAGIVCVAIGTGLLKPNVSSMVGELYGRDDERRDSGFSIFYMGINIGSFTAPFLVGLARSIGGYHAGFAVAAVGMGLALVAFVLGRAQLRGAGDHVANPLTAADRPMLVRGGLGLVLLLALAALGALAATSLSAGELSFGTSGIVNMISYLAFAAPIIYFVVMLRSPKVTAPERSRVRAYIPLFVAAMLFWMIFEQAASSMSAYAESRTRLDVLGLTIQPEFFQSVNPARLRAAVDAPGTPRAQHGREVRHRAGTRVAVLPVPRGDDRARGRRPGQLVGAHRDLCTPDPRRAVPLSGRSRGDHDARPRGLQVAVDGSVVPRACCWSGHHGADRVGDLGPHRELRAVLRDDRRCHARADRRVLLLHAVDHPAHRRRGEGAQRAGRIPLRAQQACEQRRFYRSALEQVLFSAR
jgi:amino acid/peptide:H+ symporter